MVDLRNALAAGSELEPVEAGGCGPRTPALSAR
jgi:hypothetical protein